MGWNSGLLFGKVDSAAGGIAGATVTIDWLKGLDDQRITVQLTDNDNEKGRKLISATTCNDGKYILPFYWHGVDIAKASSRMTLRSFAITANDSDRRRSPANLCMNLRNLVSNAFPTFDNPTADAFDAAKDFILEYSDISIPPFHKVFLSTETFGIFAEANFFVYSGDKS